jgi:predicted kinase
MTNQDQKIIMTNQNQKIIVTVGAAGCGKSTWSSQYVKTHKNTVIVSRDAIRKLLYGFEDSNLHEYYEGDINPREVEVSAFADTLIRKALRDGKDVIADNTHLKQSYIFAYKNYGVKIETVWVEVDEDILVKRNITRSKPVHLSVLDKQIKSFDSLYKSKQKIEDDILSFNAYIDVLYEKGINTPYNESLKDAYIFDVDGTIAHMIDRSPHDYSRVGTDVLDEGVADLLWKLNAAHASIIICSGRDGSCKEDTIEWLCKNGIPFKDIYMRKEGDHRKDWIVKAEIWDEIQDEYNILGMIDDRSQVVDFARRLGHKVYQVAPGEF